MYWWTFVWHRFNKMLEVILRLWYILERYHQTVAADLFAACPSFTFPHITKMLYWIAIWWLWGNLSAVELLQWPHCRIQEASLRWFDFCDIARYPVGCSRQCTHAVRQAVAFKCVSINVQCLVCLNRIRVCFPTWGDSFVHVWTQ